jgi:hypothetical protein
MCRVEYATRATVGAISLSKSSHFAVEAKAGEVAERLRRARNEALRERTGDGLLDDRQVRRGRAQVTPATPAAPSLILI